MRDLTGLSDEEPAASTSIVPIAAELRDLAAHLSQQRDVILHAWQDAVARDSGLPVGITARNQPAQENVYSLLVSFEWALRHLVKLQEKHQRIEGHAQGAAYGHQRWQQGCVLSDLTREVRRLHECVALGMDAFARASRGFSYASGALARQLWTTSYNGFLEAAVGQFVDLKEEAAGRSISALNEALTTIKAAERRRSELWRQAAHDLRGNLAVVETAFVVLTHARHNKTGRVKMADILQRNLASQFHLLEDVTSLARLQLGAEPVHIQSLDAAALFQQLCESVQPLAQQRGLFVRSSGPTPLLVEGDPVKLRRIAQNLVLNAIKVTREGGVTLTWGSDPAPDSGRWVLSIGDTGPGLQGARSAMAFSMPTGQDAIAAPGTSGSATGGRAADMMCESREDNALGRAPGEGLGLSIVQRLCTLLNAAIDVESIPDAGTTFRLSFPRHYQA